MKLNLFRRRPAEAGATTAWKRAQQHEVGFWRHVRRHGYGEWTWEELFNEHEREAHLSLAAKIKPVEQFKDDVVIDLGSGPIGLPCYLPCRLAIGVDPLMAVYAREYGHLHRSPPHVVWIASRGEEVALPTSCADIMYSRNVLDHVESPERWLQEFVRLLRTGGQFLLYVNLAEEWNKASGDAELHPHSFNEADMLSLMRKFPLRFKYYIDRPGARQKGVEIPMIMVGERLASGPGQATETGPF